ncbi:MAG: TonB-dependent receptor [Halioglobus sp.]|nr:TonB-dependent receptor [Halioglobus sp.]
MKRQQPSHKVFATAFALLGIPAAPWAAPVLEEVFVTAEKRIESIQDVPISIVAFNQEALENLGISDIKDLAAQVPNVQIGEFTGSPTTVRLFIRGVGQGDVQITQDPSVALYMDGVYIGSSVGTAFETADLQRIEVLRGPQGTLYGRNATGGAINIITREADPGGLRIKQSFNVGNLDLFRSTSLLNVPLKEDIAAVKLAYTTYSRDGWVDNLGNGENFGIEDRETFTGDLHWTIGDTQEMNYQYGQSAIKDTSRLSQALGFDPQGGPGAALVVFQNPAVNENGIPVEATGDRLKRATAFDEQETGDVQIHAHTLNYAWEIDDALTFKSITGYRDVNAFTQNSQVPTASLLGQYSITNGLSDTSFDQFTQEFQLLGDTDTLSWVGGLFYYEDEGEETNNGNSNGSEGLPPGEKIDYTSTRNKSLAAFGQATWTPPQLDERWHFTLGARYSEDKRKAYRDNSRVSFGFGGAPNGIPAFQANYDQDFSKFNPAFTVDYDLNANANVYAKVVTAYKAGGTSQRSTNLPNFEEGFDPEDLTSYEIGYKGDLAENRVRLNAAVFYMDYSDYQQSVATGNNPGERDFVNIDSADIKGLELDLTVAVTDELTGTFSYGYLNSGFGPETITYLGLDASAPSGLSERTEQLTDDLALAPKHSATVSLDYTRSLGFGVFTANLNAQYQDKINSGVSEPSGYLDKRTLLGATAAVSEIQLGAGYGELKVLLWGKNLTDEEYFIGNIRQAGFDLLGFRYGVGTFGDPRTYGLTLEYEFL